MSRYNKPGKSPIKFVLLMLTVVGLTYAFKDSILSASHKVANAEPLVNEKAIREIIRSEINTYFEEDPEVVINAIKRYQENEMDKQSAEANTAIAKRMSELQDPKNFPFYGNKDAKNVIVQFFDYNCGFCLKSAVALKAYMAKHKDTKMILIDFPVMGDGSLALGAVAASVFKLKPEVYSDFYFKLMDEGVRTVESAKNIAVGLGINKDQLEEVLKSTYPDTYLARARSMGMDFKVQGTPFIIINGKVFNQSLDMDSIENFIKSNN